MYFIVITLLRSVAVQGVCLGHIKVTSDCLFWGLGFPPLDQVICDLFVTWLDQLRCNGSERKSQFGDARLTAALMHIGLMAT